MHRREVYETPLRMLLGELESRLARHWPELLGDMDVCVRSALVSVQLVGRVQIARSVTLHLDAGAPDAGVVPLW